MVKLTIDENRCKGCGLCVRACPKKLLELAKQKLNEKGYEEYSFKRKGNIGIQTLAEVLQGSRRAVITIEKE